MKRRNGCRYAVSTMGDDTDLRMLAIILPGGYGVRRQLLHRASRAALPASAHSQSTCCRYGMATQYQENRTSLIEAEDWINSLNNTVSGAVSLARRHDEWPIPMGPSCIANAYIGQFTVQAVDFNILVISIAVLLTVRQSYILDQPPRWKVAIVCLIPWIPPMITGKRS
jgi:hypothetical protein